MISIQGMSYLITIIGYNAWHFINRHIFIINNLPAAMEAVWLSIIIYVNAGSMQCVAIGLSEMISFFSNKTFLPILASLMTQRISTFHYLPCVDILSLRVEIATVDDFCGFPSNEPHWYSSPVTQHIKVIILYLREYGRQPLLLKFRTTILFWEETSASDISYISSCCFLLI